MGNDGLSPAEVYERRIVPGIFGEWTPAIIARAKPAAGERVLDLACGTGALTRELGSYVGDSGSVVGLDVNTAMLDVARTVVTGEAARRVEWVEASATDIPLPDGDVDVAVCQQGLQFFPDKERAASEIARVLRPGGRIVLSVWCGLEENPVQAAFNEWLVERVGAAVFALPFSFGDAEAVSSVLRSGGLDDVEVERETRHASFESFGDFVEAHFIGASAVVPALAALGDEERKSLIDAATAELGPRMERYREGNRTRFPMTALVATARKA